MIERILVKDYLSFKDVDIELENGLMAFTGASGAGKSVLMDALLTLFGLRDAEAKVVEASLAMPLERLEEFGIEEDEPNILRYTKEKKARYFINSLALSKKNIAQICSHKIRYLSLRDDEEFSSFSLLTLLDGHIGNKDKNHLKNLEDYQKDYEKYLEVKSELDKIQEEEKKINELREFAKYEVQTIDNVNPRIGEDEELMNIKKSLSKKEKISACIEEAKAIYESESVVSEFLSLCEIDSGFFDECMNELRGCLEDEAYKLEELDDMDIESLLERIEEISKLKQRFGSIEETIEYKEQKLKELERYENLSFEKQDLQKKHDELLAKIEQISEKLHKKRASSLKALEKLINDYLKKLYLNNANLSLKKGEFCEKGKDEMSVDLNKVDIKKISSGELNRIRLAFIASKNEIQSKGEQGILILDEVDSNLSGKEAMSVANVLKEISHSYQVIAISHQPQLSSVATKHFLVSKDDGVSTVRQLEYEQRIDELSRMISGEEIKTEARDFAKKLLESNGL